MALPLSRIGVSGLIVAVSLAVTSGAAAQYQSHNPYQAQNPNRTPDPLLPNAQKRRPWERNLERFYSRGNPQSEVNKATSKLYRDPLRKLGVPANTVDSPDGSVAPVTAPPTLQPGVVEMDRNGDGSISRDEYFRGRSRLMLPRDRISSRGRREMNRLDSQFRNADRNGDGIVTPEEIEGSRNSRF